MRERQNKSQGTYSRSSTYNSNTMKYGIYPKGDLGLAESKLLDIPVESRDAHWYYLMGEIARQKAGMTKQE